MIFSLIGLFAMAIITTADTPGKIFPYDYDVTVLENGLKVITVPTNSNGIVSYYTVVRTGSRDEWEKGKSGFAHFFEHMMFRGTKRHPGGIYDSLVISMGADANAYTTDDYTCYHLTFANEDLEQVMDLESDRFRFLSYSEQAFKTESGAVYGEYRKNRTDPFEVLIEKMQDMAFSKHTYKHTTIGFEADIKDMPNQYEYSKSFYDRYYRPENCVIVVSGDFDKGKTLSLIKKYYGNWAKGYTAPQIEAEDMQKGERKAEVKYPGRSLPIIAIGYKSEAFDPADKIKVANDLFGELAFGSNSDLYKKLYLNEQKVTAFGNYFATNRDPFLNLVYAMVNKADDINYVRDEIYAAIERFKNTDVDAAKLENLKKRMKYSFLMGLDTPDNIAGGLARTIAVTGGIDAVNTYYSTLNSVSPADIRAAAAKYTPEIRNVVLLQGKN